MRLVKSFLVRRKWILHLVVGVRLVGTKQLYDVDYLSDTATINRPREEEI